MESFFSIQSSKKQARFAEAASSSQDHINDNNASILTVDAHGLSHASATDSEEKCKEPESSSLAECIPMEPSNDGFEIGYKYNNNDAVLAKLNLLDEKLGESQVKMMELLNQLISTDITPEKTHQTVKIAHDSQAHLKQEWESIFKTARSMEQIMLHPWVNGYFYLSPVDDN